ncbi:MAG: hypothetical protein Q6361_08530, partial [Candidatus Hermodarchaeota archaeon]|nr:hypothetical protein [Candidatus Hermodarchaeota archaeon]
IRLGYYIGLMKIYATKVTKIMEAHPLEPDELLGFRKMPAVEEEVAFEALSEPEEAEAPSTPEIPLESSEPMEPVEAMEEQPEPVSTTPTPTIAPVEEPGLETVSLSEASAEVNDDVSVDDKEAILAALKALGFDEPE